MTLSMYNSDNAGSAKHRILHEGALLQITFQPSLTPWATSLGPFECIAYLPYKLSLILDSIPSSKTIMILDVPYFSVQYPMLVNQALEHTPTQKTIEDCIF